MHIYIVGTSGTGKSTLARKLSQKLDISHIELDFYRFKENWAKCPEPQFQKIIRTKTIAKEWIICGNESKPLKDHLMNQATRIIWLDYPFWLIFYRVFGRTMRRILLKEKSCGGNQETFYLQFLTKKSIFLWVFQTYYKRKRQYKPILRDPKYKDKMVHLRSQKQTNAFIKTL